MSLRPHQIVVLAVPPTIGYDLAIPPLVFAEARDEGGRPLYEVRVASLGGTAARTDSGYAIVPDHDESVLADADTVVVPGTRVRGPRQEGTIAPELAAALGRIRTGTRLMSICTGAFVLAAAGMLDGRRATTHWRYLDDLARLYPRVRLDPNVLFVDDGDVLTSAGLAAGTDLCLHVIRSDHGAAVANRVARHCVVAPWREGGQAQFIEAPVPVAGDTSTASARAWALDHLAEELPLPVLARLAGMSVRTFSRRFRAETGEAPGTWLTTQRVRYAQRLLEETDLPVDAVAQRAGLGSAASMRHHLRAITGVSPIAYRRTFRGASEACDSR